MHAFNPGNQNQELLIATRASPAGRDAPWRSSSGLLREEQRPGRVLLQQGRIAQGLTAINEAENV
jgi:hypothetical protein